MWNASFRPCRGSRSRGDRAVSQRQEYRQIATLAKVAPLERLGQPDDIAKVVFFLASPDGGWINSQVVRANGGFA